MWTSPKYQARIAADRHAADHRMAAVDRRVSAAIDSSFDDAPATHATARDRIRSLPVLRLVRI